MYKVTLPLCSGTWHRTIMPYITRSHLPCGHGSAWKVEMGGGGGEAMELLEKLAMPEDILHEDNGQQCMR